MNDTFNPRRGKGSVKQNNDDVALTNSANMLSKYIENALSKNQNLSKDDLFKRLAEKFDVDFSGVGEMVTEASSGALNFNSLLPGDESPREISIEVIEPTEIESRTFIKAGSNSRIQETLNSISLAGISETLSVGGQMWPAIGVYIETETGRQIEVIDGSRRRKTCLLEGKPFTVIVFHGVLNFQQRRYLKNISNSSEEHSYYEQCLSLHGDFLEYKEENPEATKADFASQIGVEGSVVRKQLIVAEQPLWIYTALAKDAQYASLIQTKITPVLRVFEEQYSLETFKAWIERAVALTYDQNDDASGSKVIPRSQAKLVFESFSETLMKLEELPDGFIGYIAKQDLIPEIINDYLYPIFKLAEEKSCTEEIVNELRGLAADAEEQDTKLIPTRILTRELEIKLGSLKEAGDYVASENESSESTNEDTNDAVTNTQSGRSGTQRTYLRGSRKSKDQFIRWDVAKSGQESLVIKGADDGLLAEIKSLVEKHITERESQGKDIFPNDANSN